MLYVGIDWARSKHEVAIVNSSRERIGRFSIPHSGDGFTQLHGAIAKHEPDPQNVRVAIELHDGPLCDWLRDQGYHVLGVNPKSAAQVRTLLRPSGAKDDALDAFTLAQIAGLQVPIQTMPPTDDELQGLQALLAIREDAVQQKADLLRKLRGVLAEWAPTLSELCKNLGTIWQRAFLTRWPIECELAEAHSNAINAFCKKHRLPEKTREKIREARRQAPLPIKPKRAEVLQRKITCLVTRLSALLDEIREIEALLSEQCEADENSEIVDSLPSVGVASKAAWIVALRYARTHDLKWDELAAYCGVAPITKQSGNAKSVHYRRGHNRILLRIFTYHAFQTTNRDGCWAKADYRKRIDRGCAHYTAMRAIARKWIKIACALVKNQTEYSEQQRRQDQDNYFRKAA